MATSQNGWPASARAQDFAPFPWVTGRVKPGDVFTVLDYLARRFHTEVEGIEQWQSWGWNYRAVRGATSMSNHASGTAVDFNATRHVLGKRGTFNARQVAAIRRILADLGGVVRWGGDYSGRADEMHFEINATPARVATAARAIRTPTPIPSTDWFDMATEQQLREAIQWTLFNTRVDGRNIFDWAKQARAEQAAGFASVSGKAQSADVAALAKTIADQLPDDLARQVADELADRLKGA